MSDGRNYEWERNELIPAAVRFANKKAGPKRFFSKPGEKADSWCKSDMVDVPTGLHASATWADNWNWLFHRRINHLARRAGLTR